MFEVKRFALWGNTCSTFSLIPKQCLSVSGLSGSGKTVLLRVFADLDANNAELFFKGESRESFTPSAWRSRVMYLPSESAWWADSVKEHFPAEIDTSLFAELGLSAELLDAEVSRLSSGERQRLGLLRVLARKPSVLLLDEPTANLDDANAHKVEALIAAYLREESACAIWVSHDAAQRKRVSSHTLVLSDKEWVVQ